MDNERPSKFEQGKVRKFSQATKTKVQGDKKLIAQRKLSSRGHNMTRIEK